jgi:hypothetical protein
MAYIFSGEGSLDYFPCHYGSSRVLFRGPKRDTNRAYIAVLGGTEAYGKFVPDPFPDLLERDLGLSVANLGCVNAGPDLYLNEPSLTEIAAQACATVVQVMGAQNLSNRFYTVHPRRNDRFLAATPGLKALYPQVDFTEFSFTRHLLTALHSASPDRFEVIADELRTAWLARMTALLTRLRTPVALLWMAEIPPPIPTRRADLGPGPALVDAAMIRTLRDQVATYAEVVFSPKVRAQGVEAMSFGPLDAPAAAQLPGPLAHREVANRLLPLIEDLIQ